MHAIDGNFQFMFCFAAYMSSPCHIELTLSEKEEPVKKEVTKVALYFYLLRKIQ